MTAFEAAQHLRETSEDSIERAKMALAEVEATIERLHERRRRTEELLSKLRRTTSPSS
jgi:SHS2 domain-containing protein